MAITRLNAFHAKPGRGAALRRFLASVITDVRAAPGCRSCELYEALDDLLVWSPAFHHADLRPDADEAALAVAVDQVLRDQPKVGHNPQVFWYQLVHDPARLTALRIMFYEGFSAYAVADHRSTRSGSLTSA